MPDVPDMEISAVSSVGFQPSKSEIIEGGLASEAVFLHHLNNHPTYEKIIEKATTRKWEIFIAELIHEKPVSVFPEIFMISRTEEKANIFMEYLPKVGRPPDLTRSVSQAIASAIARLDRLDMKSEILNDRRARLDPRVTDKHVSQTGLSKKDQAALTSRISALTRYRNMLPTALAHNDIHWNNLEWCAERQRCRFIDFALVGLNMVGADFQSFARGALRSRKNAKFMKWLVDDFADCTGLPKETICFGAYLTSLARSVARIARYEIQEQKIPLSQEIDIMYGLLGKAEYYGQAWKDFSSNIEPISPGNIFWPRIFRFYIRNST